MRAATWQQAKLIQKVRPIGTAADKLIEEISSLLAVFVCPHEREGLGEHAPRICPLCKLYSMALSLKLKVEGFNIDLDDVLSRAEVRDPGRVRA